MSISDNAGLQPPRTLKIQPKEDYVVVLSCGAPAVIIGKIEGRPKHEQHFEVLV